MMQGAVKPHRQVYAAVLGGIGSVKHYLENEAKGNANLRMAVLSQALRYGKDGLELLMSALTHKSWYVQCYAYSLLQENVEPELKQALQPYNPYLLLECLHILPDTKYSGYSQSPDGQTVACNNEKRDGTINLWDAGTGELKSTLTPGHSEIVHCFAFSASK